jgi:hypothetical protein
MTMETRQDKEAEKASSLKARAERCRELARVASSPFAARMLQGLAQQLDGEAARATPGAPLGHAAA